MRYLGEGTTVNRARLSQVAEVSERPDAKGEFLWDGISDDGDNILLNVAVILASDLF